MINLDYSEPVCEATNSLINILLNHSNKLILNNDLYIKLFDRLENQIDCEVIPNHKSIYIYMYIIILT